MERDTIISHGITDFLARIDDGYVVINIIWQYVINSGMISIYNPAKEIIYESNGRWTIKIRGFIGKRRFAIRTCDTIWSFISV